MILDMSDALSEWERPTTIKTVSSISVDFVVTETVVGRTQNCVVQVADRENVNPETIDWSLENLLVHSKLPILIDELLEHDDRDFIITQKGPWRGYGYYEVVATETKRPTVEVTL